MGSRSSRAKYTQNRVRGERRRQGAISNREVLTSRTAIVSLDRPIICWFISSGCKPAGAAVQASVGRRTLQAVQAVQAVQASVGRHTLQAVQASVGRHTLQAGPSAANAPAAPDAGWGACTQTGMLPVAHMRTGVLTEAHAHRPAGDPLKEAALECRRHVCPAQVDAVLLFSPQACVSCSSRCIPLQACVSCSSRCIPLQACVSCSSRCPAFVFTIAQQQ